MRNMSKAKRTALIVALFIAVFGISIAGTYALLTSRAAGLTNTFEVGSVETEIHEDGMELKTDTSVKKNPSIVNVGENACFIRARVEISPADMEITLGQLGQGWTAKQADGFYYYTAAVPAGNATNPIFEEVILPSGWVSGGVATEAFQDFDVIVYQEAVQAELVSRGTAVTDYVTIWEDYDNYQAEITR